METRPVVKDVSLNLLNAPKELMLGNKQYSLKFAIMNLKQDSKDLVLNLSSGSLELDQNSLELALGPQERKAFEINVKPLTDGELQLGISIIQKKTITFTEKVLEGQEDQQKSTITAPSPKPVSVQPIKPAPVKPIKPLAEKPVPVKPMKTAGTKPVSTQEASTSSLDILETHIKKVREEYMAARVSLESLSPDSKEYKDTYQGALKLKEEYEKYKAIYEAGGPVPDELLSPINSEEIDPLEELKVLMERYNDLKEKISSMDQSNPNYIVLREEAMKIYKEYNEKRLKAKEQGLID